jgi:heme-degrading monooxygenase HmoA
MASAEGTADGFVAGTPNPPYTAVIFSSVRTADDEPGYAEMAAAMEALSCRQPGYLGIESVRDAETGAGITVSYWASDADAAAWKGVAEHLVAQRLGRDRWYARYRVRVATVTRAYGVDAGA